MTIGIIGHGYVGSAVANSYVDETVLINDPKMVDSVSVEDLMSACRAIFVCVPTPTDSSGACDVSILVSVLQHLQGYDGVVISKSTAPPMTYRRLERTLDIRLAHVPEFLTQARAKFDYLNPHKIVVGCERYLQPIVADVLMCSAINFDRLQIEYCDIAAASFFKYMTNNMLAAKVILNNELCQLAQSMGLDWTSISKLGRTDHRLGTSHWAVPGPDGQLGFGGACFPKDTEAFQHIASEQGVDLPLLKSVIEINRHYRK